MGKLFICGHNVKVLEKRRTPTLKVMQEQSRTEAEADSKNTEGTGEIGAGWWGTLYSTGHATCQEQNNRPISS